MSEYGEFTYDIKGITLNMVDMNRIKFMYEVFLTAGYLMENYNYSKKKALDIATQVRDLMFKREYMTELEAIEEVLSEE